MVRALARVLRRMPADAAAAALQPELLPRLFQAFEHPAADVRKAVRRSAVPPEPCHTAQPQCCMLLILWSILLILLGMQRPFVL